MEVQTTPKAPSEREMGSLGSDSSGSSSSSEDETANPREGHANWTVAHDVAFANAMVEQIHHGKTTKNGLKKQAWSQIRIQFYQRTGCNYTQHQLRNRKGVLKRQYQILKQLLEQPGFQWDGNRQVVVAEDAVWNEYLKVHPEADKMRNRRFPVYDQLCVISGDPSNKCGFIELPPYPSMGDNTPDETQQSSQEQAHVDEPPSMSPPGVQDKDSTDLARDLCIIQNRNKRRSTTPSSSSHNKRKESVTSYLAEAVYEFADALRFKTLASEPNGDPYAIGKCIKELEATKGVTDHEVFGAIDLFRDPLLREAFITMQPQRRLRWIRTQINAAP